LDIFNDILWLGSWYNNVISDMYSFCLLSSLLLSNIILIGFFSDWKIYFINTDKITAGDGYVITESNVGDNQFKQKHKDSIANSIPDISTPKTTQ